MLIASWTMWKEKTKIFREALKSNKDPNCKRQQTNALFLLFGQPVVTVIYLFNDKWNNCLLNIFIIKISNLLQKSQSI